MEQSTKSSAKVFKERYCTIIIVVVTALCFLVPDLLFSREMIAGFEGAGALSWQQVIVEGEYYRLITYMFLHANIEHIANNMLILALAGDILERGIGHGSFLLVYFMSGVLAGLTSIIYNMNVGAYVRSMGASGAVFGIVGAIAMLLVLNKGQIRSMNLRRLVLFISISIYGGIASNGIDNAAHIGGLIAGALIALLMHSLTLLLKHIRRS